MSAIIPGNITIKGHYRGDELDVSFDIEMIDLTHKTLFCQCRPNPGANVVLEFSETDGSLTKTVFSSTKTSIRFYKQSSEMKINPNTYSLTMIMFTNTSDIETIMGGSIQIIPQITQKL